MAFKEGHKKYGGRQKGTQNKTTQSQKEVLAALLEANQEKLQQELGKLEGKDFVFAYEKLLAYVIPKNKQVENINSFDLSNLQFLVNGEEVLPITDENQLLDEAD